MDIEDIPTWAVGEILPTQTIESYRRQGLLRLRGAVVAEHVARCQERLWIHLAASGAVSADPGTWQSISPGRVKALASHRDFAFARVPALAMALDQLVGPRRSKPNHSGGNFLISPPSTTGEQWHLPRGRWHWDGDLDPHPCASVRVFTILAPLASRQGGTLLISGSHSLVRAFATKESVATQTRRPRRQRKHFERLHPWLAALQQDQPNSEELTAAMMDRSFTDEGQELRIFDVHGDAGDVIFVDGLLILSAPSWIGPGPRMMHSWTASALAG
jgi:hypothetical protein